VKRGVYWLPLLGVFLSGLLVSAQPVSKTGIVKGVVTIRGKPAPDAVVSIEGLPKEKPRPRDSKLKTANAVMDQREMKFVPRVLAVLVGTNVDFTNNDKTWHNVYSTSAPKKFDLGLYPPQKTRSVTFDKPGIVRILCNVHPPMEAFIVVKDHPFFAVTEKRGNYELDNVPLGKYVVEVWHPDFGAKKFPFELVREGQVLDLDIDLKK
jgi:plastocyanin